jgi:hypothetical protein
MSSDVQLLQFCGQLTILSAKIEHEIAINAHLHAVRLMAGLSAR